jgi:methyltransferase (TIGR00027 family)
MTRSDSDTWDLASSVGATATMVAAARARASEQPNAIINDPFAAPLVRAVGIDFFTRVVDGEVGAADAGEGVKPELQHETDSLAVRTRFFDEFFVDASAVGAGQAVILAAGLDSRPYRLPWPTGSVVYEVDQPEVIDFKTATLAALGAAPTAERRTVSIDLRDDWPAALRAGGFDPDRPTAWSAEGLLMYLPPEAQDRLFDNITALSAPGSQLATEFHPEDGPTMAERAQQFNDRWAGLGCDINLSGLFYEGKRSNVVDYLSGHGWQVTTRPRRELFTEYGLAFPEDDGLGALRNIIAVTAIRR